MAARTKLRNVNFLWSPSEPFRWAHRIHRIVIGIATVTARATQAGLTMDVRNELFGRVAQLPFECRVASHAGVASGRGQCGTKKQKRQGARSEALHVTPSVPSGK